VKFDYSIPIGMEDGVLFKVEVDSNGNPVRVTEPIDVSRVEMNLRPMCVSVGIDNAAPRGEPPVMYPAFGLAFRRTHPPS
jgi:hypothetical protein